MAGSVKILGVNGSVRKTSRTRRVLKHVIEEARNFGAEIESLDLGETPLTLFHPDGNEATPALERANELVLWADAYVLGSPDYHGSMSGVMKNFLDHYWHEFTGKLFGYVIASHEKGLTVQDQMRTAIRQCYGWSLPYGLGFNGDEDLNPDGSIKNPRLEQRVRMLARDMVVYGGLLRVQFLADLAKSPRDPGFAERFTH